jgi:hypothetical protein
MSQAAINRLLAEQAARGARIVRLMGAATRLSSAAAARSWGGSAAPASPSKSSPASLPPSPSRRSSASRSPITASLARSTSSPGTTEKLRSTISTQRGSHAQTRRSPATWAHAAPVPSRSGSPPPACRHRRRPSR